MLMELYFYLYGYPSVYFGDDNKIWTSYRQKLTPGDRGLIDYLVDVGNQHQTVSKFIKKHSTSVTGESPSGTYKIALAQGMKDALQSYYCTLSQLEHYTSLNVDALTPTLMDAKINVGRHQGDFETLTQIIANVERLHLDGCQILNYLEENIADKNGILKKVTIGVNKQFYYNLREWLLFGTLEPDPLGQFFIRVRIPNSSAIQNENFTEDEFEINPEQCPDFIKPEVIEQIFETGKIVHMILNEPNKTTTKIKTLDMHFSWKYQISHFEKALWNFHNDFFSSLSFRKIINEFQQFASERLWQMTMKSAALNVHLGIIRDYFLLGRGEIFQAFLVQNEQILRANSSLYYSKGLNKAFEMTLSTFNEYIEYPLRGLNFYCIETKEPKTRCETIRLLYQVPWPLHVIFTKEIIQNYGLLFNFLFNLKNTELLVKQLWTMQMQQKYKNKIDIGVILLRNKCMYVIRNILAYMQVDVIESRFTTLLNEVDKAKDFDTIKKAHWEFYSSVINESFLLLVDKQPHKTRSSSVSTSDNSVSVFLKELISTINEFCMTANSWDVTLTEAETKILLEYQNKIDNLIQYPVKLWSDKSTEYGVQINRLLLRMMNLY